MDSYDLLIMEANFIELKNEIFALSLMMGGVALGQAEILGEFFNPSVPFVAIMIPLSTCSGFVTLLNQQKNGFVFYAVKSNPPCLNVLESDPPT
jgi:hypothetical protein